MKRSAAVAIQIGHFWDTGMSMFPVIHVIQSIIVPIQISASSYISWYHPNIILFDSII